MTASGDGPDPFTVIRSQGGPDRDQVNPPGTGTFGFAVLLASLSVLFVASVAGYLYVRINASQWPPAGMPGLPISLWLSTAVLLGCSVFVHRALKAIQKDDQKGLRRNLLWTLVLGSLFLVLQTLNYVGLAQSNLTAKTNLYGFTFYLLTGLHAAHVIGGLIPLAIVTRRARRGRYSSFFHPGVTYSAMYWHFLDGAWVVLFAVLLIGS